MGVERIMSVNAEWWGQHDAFRVCRYAVRSFFRPAHCCWVNLGSLLMGLSKPARRSLLILAACDSHVISPHGGAVLD